MKAKSASKNIKNYAFQEIAVVSGRLEASPNAMNFFIQIHFENFLFLNL
jgi:hypothetical protein